MHLGVSCANLGLEVWFWDSVFGLGDLLGVE